MGKTLTLRISEVRATLKRHGLRPVYRIERDGNGVGVLMWAEPILAPEP